MRRIIGTALGKTVAKAVAARGKSAGQSMPGLVVEKLIPGYLEKMLEQLPEGVVIITGTNGKTTTTKMVVELLRGSYDKKVLTNATGSNLMRGIISTVSRAASKTGHLPYDIAVFELDEAYADQFTDVIKPRFVLGLNASRDQLDRFGEVDTVAKLIGDTMLTATEGIITNADDKRLSTIVATAEVPVRYFGVAPDLLHLFPRDDELVAVDTHARVVATKPAAQPPIDVELAAIDHLQHATYRIDGQEASVALQVTGQHNFQNAAAALSLLRAILPSAEPQGLVHLLAQVRPAFGRGQQFILKNGSRLQLNLVKNPASFRQGLASYVDTTAERPVTMIAINDGVADSRDMSWLWDVDFSTLQGTEVAFVAGTRAADMALRLQYDDIAVGSVEPDIDEALRKFCAGTGAKVIFASYTAMLRLHRLLEQKAGTKL